MTRPEGLIADLQQPDAVREPRQCDHSANFSPKSKRYSDT